MPRNKPRDPQRIGLVLDEIRRVWEKRPDTRLGSFSLTLRGTPKGLTLSPGRTTRCWQR